MPARHHRCRCRTPGPARCRSRAARCRAVRSCARGAAGRRRERAVRHCERHERRRRAWRPWPWAGTCRRPARTPADRRRRPPASACPCCRRRRAGRCLSRSSGSPASSMSARRGPVVEPAATSRPRPSRQSLARVRVGGGHDGLAGAHRVGQRARTRSGPGWGTGVTKMSAAISQAPSSSASTNRPTNRTWSATPSDVASALSRSPVGLALAAEQLRVRGAHDHVERRRVGLDHGGHRRDGRLVSLARAQQAEAQDDRSDPPGPTGA